LYYEPTIQSNPIFSYYFAITSPPSHHHHTLPPRPSTMKLTLTIAALAVAVSSAAAESELLSVVGGRRNGETRVWDAHASDIFNASRR
jgi:hypothetical protein